MRALAVILIVFGVNLNIMRWTGDSLLIATEYKAVVVCPVNAPCATEAFQPLLSIITMHG